MFYLSVLTGGGQRFSAYALYWLFFFFFFAIVSKYLTVSNLTREAYIMTWGMQAIKEGKARWQGPVPAACHMTLAEKRDL